MTRPIEKDIRGLLDRLTVSDAQLARHLGVCHKTVQAWRKGAGSPSPAYYNRLLTVLEQSPGLLRPIPGEE